MRALVALLASAFPLVLAGRCFPQLLPSVGNGTIQLFNTSSGKVINDVPEGIPPLPAMPGQGPFFTSELKSGQICYTGGATGTMKPIEVCSWSVAFKAYKEALAKANAASSKNSDEQIKLLAEYAESLAATGCVDLETQTDPQSLYPSLAKYVKFQGKNMTMTQVYGRICRDPAILVSDEARFEKAVTPWEFSNIQSDAAACRCPLDTEYFSENFVESDPAVSSYVDHLTEANILVEEPSKTTLPTSGTPVLGTCNVNRNGYGWAGTDVTGLTVWGLATRRSRSTRTKQRFAPALKTRPRAAACSSQTSASTFASTISRTRRRRSRSRQTPSRISPTTAATRSRRKTLAETGSPSAA